MSDEVRSVEVYVVDSGSRKRWVFVRVAAADGVDGWGECYTGAGREAAIAALAEELGRALVGLSSGAIRPFTVHVLRDLAGKRNSMELSSALSGIEQALWDITGKRLGQPVHRLLGGAVHDRLRVYANGWSYEQGWDRASIERVAERARAVVDRGFTALKLDPFPGTWRSYISAQEEQSAVACVAAVREAVGPDVDILVECHRRLSPYHAVRVARLLEEYEPFWYEEPVPAAHLPELAEVRRSVPFRIVTGETLYDRAAIADVLEQRAADVLNPDVASCGGILELTLIGAMAEARLVAMAPHNYNSTTVALAATAQAAATMPNFLITEFFVDTLERCQEIAITAPELVDGHILVPNTPGVGAELDVAALSRR